MKPISESGLKTISIFLIILTILSFFLGFYIDETATNGYVDLNWIQKNIKIFLDNSILDAIKHPEYFGNRSPLMYIIHSLFNPFLENTYYYRITVFLFSISGPILFFLCLKNKYKENENILLILISTIILLSPYYRSSAFWGLEENYAVIFTFLSFLSLNAFLSNNEVKNFYSYFIIFLIALSSSLCIYFDQKYLLIPLISYISVILSKKSLKYKIFLTLIYFLFALPYLYLFLIWGGINPPLTAAENPNSITQLSRISNLYFPHIGYAITMIAFYLFPMIFFMRKNIREHYHDLLGARLNLFLISLFIVYLFYLIIFFNYEEFTTTNYWIGLGYIHKLSLFFFNNSLVLQKAFTLFSFTICWIIIMVFINSKIRNLLIVIYFLIISIFLWPLMQEYFDPLVLILSLLFFYNNFEINYRNTFFLYLYFLIFFIGVVIYYSGPPIESSHPTLSEIFLIINNIDLSHFSV
tara:strand:- start:55 stop:1458 length:1404 start_codon:yes stop_codon:yes gene_type:complete